MHQVILPKEKHGSKLMARELHNRGHKGPEYVLSKLKRNTETELFLVHIQENMDQK